MIDGSTEDQVLSKFTIKGECQKTETSMMQSY